MILLEVGGGGIFCRRFLEYFKLGFVNFSIDVLSCGIFCCGGCYVFCRICSRIIGFYLLEVSSTFLGVIIKNVFIYC